VPAVSVVVICFNDAGNLATAVKSATAQTFRDLEVLVVDDGSTDATPEVARSLAATDPRVRYLRLDDNSGGCSRPRNVGLTASRGDYVAFLDSDDVLPRRAVARLMTGAQRADADLTCGRLLRRHHDPTRFLAAYADLYRRAAVLRSIADRPAQLADTPAVAKLYRRSFLHDQKLEFPEGLLFEDLLFTTQAYCTARTIAVVPDLAYVWNVRHEAPAPSITNRGDVRSWRDRFEIHRRIDAFLATHGVPDEVIAAKHQKFLSHDLVLFLRALRAATAEDRLALLGHAQSYVSAMPAQARRSGPAGCRVAATLAACGDLDRLMSAADYVVTGGVRSDLAADGQRLLWTAAHPEEAVGLDVTDTGLLDAGFADTPFLAGARSARWTEKGVEVEIVVADVLGRLGPAQQLSGHLLVSGRLGGPLSSSPLQLTEADGGIEARGEVDLRLLGRSLGRPTIGHELRLAVELRRDAATARRPLSGRDAELPATDAPLPSPWRALVGDRVRLLEVNGRLVLQLSALPAITRRGVAAGSWAKYAAEVALARLRRS
jgi:CDP-glycerol glycerophosphotransferase